MYKLPIDKSAKIWYNGKSAARRALAARRIYRFLSYRNFCYKNESFSALILKLEGDAEFLMALNQSPQSLIADSSLHQLRKLDYCGMLKAVKVNHSAQILFSHFLFLSFSFLDLIIAWGLEFVNPHV